MATNHHDDATGNHSNNNCYSNDSYVDQNDKTNDCYANGDISKPTNIDDRAKINNSTKSDDVIQSMNTDNAVTKSKKSNNMTTSNANDDITKADNTTDDIESTEKSCRKRCYVCCLPCSAKHAKSKLSTTSTFRELCHYSITCPPHGPIAKVLTLAVVAVLIWAVLWSIFGTVLFPRSNLFGIVVLFIASTIGGYVAEFCKLPPLLGMLLFGILVGNVPYIDYGRDIDRAWSSGLRKIALVVILIRAGLGLNVEFLLRLKYVVIRMAFIPLLVEATTIAVCMRYLMGFPWDWAFIQGFVISAVSAAVAIPFMLQFQASGLGVAKGIPTLLMAAASIDNVTSITCFSIVLGIHFSADNLAYTIAKGPLQLIAGVVVGVLWGVLLWYIPYKRNPHKAIFRFVILFGGSLLAVFGSGAGDFASAGPLGVLVISVVAAYRWRKQGWKGAQNPMPPVFGHLWTIFQILLFGLVGALVDIRSLDWLIVGKGVGIFSIGLVGRLVMAFLMPFGSILNGKEKLFAMFTWLPKATVQAAIGSMALDRAHDTNASEEEIQRGVIVLTIAVASIIVTSPIGAAAVAISGPRLLERSNMDMEVGITEDEDSGAEDDHMTSQNDDSSKHGHPCNADSSRDVDAEIEDSLKRGHTCNGDSLKDVNVDNNDSSKHGHTCNGDSLKHVDTDDNDTSKCGYTENMKTGNSRLLKHEYAQTDSEKDVKGRNVSTKDVNTQNDDIVNTTGSDICLEKGCTNGAFEAEQCKGNQKNEEVTSL